MKDWFFYPLIAMIGAAMIAFALRAGGPAEVVDPLKGYEVSGTMLQILTVAPGTTMELKGDGVNPISYAVMSAHAGPEEAPSAGIFAMMGEEYSRAYAGKTLNLTIRARAGQKNPAPQFLIGFFKRGKGRLTWQKFTPTAEYSEYNLTTILGPFDAEQPELYFGIWPDAKGKGQTIEVESYKVSVAEP